MVGNPSSNPALSYETPFLFLISRSNKLLWRLIYHIFCFMLGLLIDEKRQKSFPLSLHPPHHATILMPYTNTMHHPCTAQLARQPTPQSNPSQPRPNRTHDTAARCTTQRSNWFLRKFSGRNIIILRNFCLKYCLVILPSLWGWAEKCNFIFTNNFLTWFDKMPKIFV